MTVYKSSVLRCNAQEDGCPVCEFLKLQEIGSNDGSHASSVMRAVIRILDEKLAESERRLETMTEMFLSMAEGDS